MHTPGIRLCWPTALDTRTAAAANKETQRSPTPPPSSTPIDLYDIISTGYQPHRSILHPQQTPQQSTNHDRPTQPHPLPLRRPPPNNPRPRRRNAQLPSSPPAKEPRPTPSPQLGLLARPSRPRPCQSQQPPIPLSLRQQHTRRQHRLRRAPRAPRLRKRHPLLLEPLQQLRHHPAAPPRQRAPLQARRQTHLGRPSERAGRVLDVPRAQTASARILEGGLHAGDRGAVASGCGGRGGDDV